MVTWLGTAVVVFGVLGWGGAFFLLQQQTTMITMIAMRAAAPPASKIIRHDKHERREGSSAGAHTPIYKLFREVGGGRRTADEDDADGSAAGTRSRRWRRERASAIPPVADAQPVDSRALIADAVWIHVAAVVSLAHVGVGSRASGPRRRGQEDEEKRRKLHDKAR